MNALTLLPAERPAEEPGGGATRSHRRYAEFVIDGMPLGPVMRRVQDLISRVGWGPDSYRQEALGVLLLEREADFPGNRRALYVCPECGDLACGAVTAVIERQGDRVVWRDFDYETEIDLPVAPEALRALGPFTFDWVQYQACLQEHISQAAPDPPRLKAPWWKRRIL